MPCYILEYLSFQKNRMTIEEEIYYFYVWDLVIFCKWKLKTVVIRKKQYLEDRKVLIRDSIKQVKISYPATVL